MTNREYLNAVLEVVESDKFHKWFGDLLNIQDRFFINCIESCGADDVYIEYEVSVCSCCPNETHYQTIDLDFIEEFFDKELQK